MHFAFSFARPATLIVALVSLFSLQSPALARPHGGYGQGCAVCHTGGFLDGRATPNKVLGILPQQRSMFPGDTGESDVVEGAGVSPTYTADPGDTIQLLLQIKDPTIGPDAFAPERFALGLKQIYVTDPDYQAGNPDKNTWRNDQLTLVGARLGGSGNIDPEPIPLDETGWVLWTDNTFMQGAGGDPFFDLHVGEDYYTSAETNGHAWAGPMLMSLTITVPAGVLPGLYDIEISAEGIDSDYLGFYDEQHFFLRVLPEPATAALLLLGLPWLRRRR